MQSEQTKNGQSDEGELTQIAPIDTSKIKIPDKLMEEAVDAFTFGKTRPQFADKILDNLPEELKILTQIERSEAKKLLCRRLRSADPSSKRFAHKFKKRYQEAIQSLKETSSATVPTEILKIIESLKEMNNRNMRLNEKLQTMLDDDKMDTREILNAVKMIHLTDKAYRDNAKAFLEMAEQLKKACRDHDKSSGFPLF